MKRCMLTLLKTRRKQIWNREFSFKQWKRPSQSKQVICGCCWPGWRWRWRGSEPLGTAESSSADPAHEAETNQNNQLENILDLILSE